MAGMIAWGLDNSVTKGEYGMELSAQIRDLSCAVIESWVLTATGFGANEHEIHD